MTAYKTGQKFERVFKKMCERCGYSVTIPERRSRTDLRVGGLRVQCKALTPNRSSRSSYLRVKLSPGGTGSTSQYRLDDCDLFAIWVFGFGLHIAEPRQLKIRKGAVAVAQPIYVLTEFHVSLKAGKLQFTCEQESQLQLF